MCFKRKTMLDVVNECEKINQILKNETVCFTGHRSQKLPWGFNESDERCLKMKEKLKTEIVKTVESGYTTFISGMALGFDMICAELVLELKKTYPHIKLICALPCKNQYKKWSDRQRQRYKNILKQADIVRYVSEEYTDTCMLERNDYMLNNSSIVIALYNGKGGGTGYTIKKAKTMNLQTMIINPITF